MAGWQRDGRIGISYRGRRAAVRGTRQAACQQGDHPPPGRVDELTGDGRDGVHGPPAAVVPPDVGGEPVLALRRLPWFRRMSAENRSWLGLVAQAAVAAFVDWVKHPERGRPAVAGEVFGTAPRELARAVSLQQAVEMMRVIIDVVEAQVDELAAPGGEAELREAVLRYTREIAFAAAQVYARTAEARGAWDARLEALVVDSLVRGEVDEGLQSWASALNWSSVPVAVMAGIADGSEPEGLIDKLRIIARRSRLDLLAGVHGHRLVVVLGGAADPVKAAGQFAGRFGAGPVVVGPSVTNLQSAALSASAALAGLRAAAAWPDAPR